MGIYQRVVRGAEAGAITAGAVETLFFLLDLVRLEPFATPAALSGVGVAPGGFSLDLTSFSGIASVGWVTYQVWLLTLAHFAAYALAGVAASFAFDWSRWGGVGRLAGLTALSAGALVIALALSSSIVNLGALGVGSVVTMLVAAPVILGTMLRVLSMPEPEPQLEAVAHPR